MYMLHTSLISLKRIGVSSSSFITKRIIKERNGAYVGIKRIVCIIYKLEHGQRRRICVRANIRLIQK